MLRLFLIVALIVKIISGVENSENKPINLVNSTNNILEGKTHVPASEGNDRNAIQKGSVQNILRSEMESLHSVNGNDTVNNETKIFNSLPEKQKAEFLQKVEQRIKKEVPDLNSTEDVTNVDLVEKQLEAQGESIKKILRSEIDKLPSLDEQHIDLTLRSQKEEIKPIRRNKEGTVKLIVNKNERSTETHVPVIVQYDSEPFRNHSNSTYVQNQKTDVKNNKNESKVDQITWENINTIMKYENSSTERKRTGRRSNNLDLIPEKLNTALENSNISISSNATTTVEIKQTSYSLDSGTKQYTNNLKTENFTPTYNRTKDNTDTVTDAAGKNRDTSPTINILQSNYTDSSSTLNSGILIDTLQNTEYPQTDEGLSTTNVSKYTVEASTLLNYYNDTTVDNIGSSKSTGTVNARSDGTTIAKNDTKLPPSLQLGTNSADILKEYNNTTTDTVNVTGNLSNTDKDIYNDVVEATTINVKTTIVSQSSGTKVNNLNVESSKHDNATVVHESSTIQSNLSHSESNINNDKSVNTDKKININQSVVLASPKENTKDDPNNLNPDLSRNADTERQPEYVPVHNYDAENAYFNPNNLRIKENTYDGKKGNTSDVVKITENQLNSTDIQIETNKETQSLRVKDVKERILSQAMNQNFDLFGMILGGSVESSENDLRIEKPLKHSLKKIRKKLYKNKMKDKSNLDLSQMDIDQRDEETVEKDDVTNHFIKNIQPQTTEQPQNENPEVKESDLESGTFSDIAHSLEQHNMVIQNEGIKEVLKLIEKIKNKPSKKSKDKVDNQNNQFRFEIKGRDEKHKMKMDTENYDNSGKLHNVNKPRVFKSKDVNSKKSKDIEIDDSYLKLHIDILKDLIDRNDKALEQYDWLGTTVRIRGGIAKLQNIIKDRDAKRSDQLDSKLLAFVLSIYEEAVASTAENEENPTQYRRKQRLSFRIPKSKSGKSFNRLHRIFGEKRTKRPRTRRENREDFNVFLEYLKFYLNNLHTAIRQVSSITSYNDQHWFKNIKQLYLNPANDKQRLELFLHLVTARLFNLLDERTKELVKNQVFTKNQASKARIAAEALLIKKIIEEFMKIND